MLWQTAIGILVTSICVFIQTLIIAFASRRLAYLKTWIKSPYMTFKHTLVLVAIMAWLVLGISLSCCAWTFVFLNLGAIDGLEPAIYFAMVSFTTLGFGDIVLPQGFRLLSGFTAVSGLFVFGLTSAFIVDMLAALRSTEK